ncbi:pantetheinase-like [Paramacrobiotus metropolitanus]|uniref:pantetheinase-like n=1 Tax=Paramacrobiotus metropolitanus TaxID=2943436 RepID=UPI002445DE77|nr:pantetheinase-like [Paramacrobiotus metropolitanus]
MSCMDYEQTYKLVVDIMRNCQNSELLIMLLFLFLPLLFLTNIRWTNGQNSVDRSKADWKVAVYEHKPVGTGKDPPVQLMLQNLRAYAAAATEAAALGARLIVFPEYGLLSTASYSSRDQLLKYLQQIPTDPDPCESSSALESEVIKEISCLAKSHGLTIIVNLGTIHWCNHTGKSNPQCPPDGRFQYNSNLVFNERGAIIAVYHKYNLFGERFFDTPPLDFVTFTTPWGVIGVGTCFDLLQSDPLLRLIQERRVDAVVLPSLWFNRIPFLALYEIAEGWAVRTGITLLVANVHSPITAHVGSGIFGPDGVIDYTYVTDVSSGGQLIVAPLPMPVKGQSRAVPSALILNSHENDQHAFQTMTNGDLFWYTALGEGINQNTIFCRDNLCCQVNYTYKQEPQHPGYFALGLFSGMHTENYTLYNEMCAVVRCLDERHCGDGIASAVGGLSDLSLTGNFSSGSYAYPTVLVDNALLASAGQWRFDRSRQVLHGSESLKSILVFGLYGRNFAKDRS